MRGPLVILADDLTGASDAGVPFLNCGARTTVWIDRAGAYDAGAVTVVDLDTRAVAPSLAAERMSATLAALPANARIVKKIDSTLRGNIAAELGALLLASPNKTAIVVPAYPRNGRTQRDGVVCVDGTPVHETDFGRDLLTPVRSSRIADYLPRGASAVVGSASGIETALRAGVRAIAVDAERDEDLIAIAALAADDRFIWAGSAGLLELLAPFLARDVVRDRTGSHIAASSIAASSSELARKPILFVIGSLSDATRRQIVRYVGSGARVEMVDPRTVLIDEGRGRAEVVAERIRTTLEGGEDLLVALSSDRSDVEAAFSLGRAHGYDARTTSLELRERFVELVQRAVPLAGAVVLSGADVARSFCKAAGVHGLGLVAEAAPGIPLSRSVGGDLRLVTKAGGSGSADAFLEIVRGLRTHLVA